MNDDAQRQALDQLRARVQRTVIPTIPPQVEYRLTGLGMELVARLESLVGWLEEQAPAIETARRAYYQ